MIRASTFLNLPSDQITPELEEEFFTSLRLRNGTYKTTFQRRFVDINKVLLELIDSGELEVSNTLDIGISSGSNTLELHHALDASGYKSQFVGTDVMVDAYLVRVFPGCFALVDDTGYPLRYDLFKWTMKPWVTRKDYKSGFFIFRKCINLALGYRASQVLKKASGKRVRRVQLVTPALRDHGNIVVRKDDITRHNDKFDGKFNFIRAANVLNKGYFADNILMSILDNLKRYLASPGGALLIVRTHGDGVNHGTLFAVERGAGCKVLRRFGEGSEVEDIVLECMRGP